MLLPVGPSTASRAVRVRAVVTVLEVLAFGAGGEGGPAASRVAAPQQGGRVEADSAPGGGDDCGFAALGSPSEVLSRLGLAAQPARTGTS